MFDSVQPPPSEPGRFRAVLKLLALGVLVLLLLIPVSQLLGLVRERKSRQAEVREEIAKLWGDEQTLGAHPSLSHVAARQEVMSLMAALRLPLNERGQQRVAAQAEWVAAREQPLEMSDMIGD